MGARGASASWAAVGGVAVACLLFLLLLTAAPAAAQRGAPAASPVIVLQVDEAIGPATTEYLRSGLLRAKEQGSPLVVLVMDTPGGLDSSTRDIIGDILASEVPVATFVAPAGARAASAGTYILYASHLAAMAPGTHLGAATPVALGGPATPLPGAAPDDKAKKDGPTAAPPDAMSAKVTNDAAAYIASLAALQGRNAEFAERAVREAATLTSDQAKARGVIELVASDLRDLLAQADGRTVKVNGQPRRLDTAGRPLADMQPSWRVRVLGVITNPNIAYLLFLIGLYGLMFELMSPGMVAPGIIGAIALVTALFALNLLPVNYAGLLLLLIGLGLMTAEALNPSVGAFGIGGVVAFALGSLMTFKGPIPEYQLSPGVVLVAVALSLAYFALALGSAFRARRGALAIGPDTLIRAPGRVVSWSGDAGLVRVQGEDWQARAAAPLAPGRGVHVVRRDGLALFVEPDDTPDPPARPAA
ncbi:nodulation protein NfeD [Phenylobacterium sp. LjRoot219]|uniref:NfeD family protein n=1 Tax=Phenylobacterium sp. LjRoot219 TaxID=3342283 RepID=UPI003ECF447C